MIRKDVATQTPRKNTAQNNCMYVEVEAGNTAA